MKNHREVETLLDQATAQIRAAEPDPQRVREAADRVWARLTSASAATAAGAAEIEEIRGCEDYQALIPAYLAGSLPEARRLLLEDHSRECVPCRRALKQAREGKPPAPPAPRRAGKVVAFPFPPAVLRWAAAAVLAVGVGAALYVLSGMLLYGGVAATVETVDGQLFRVTETAHLPVAAGDDVRRGEVLRTGRAGDAVLRLADGSRIEVRERSELSLSDGHRGTTVELERGNVIVEAAAQRRRHLYVETDDCLVSVTGTIFSVNHGTKGSRVSVVEGEVYVAHGGEETVLHPGEQIATHARLGAVPVEDEIAWSRNVDEYVELLREYQDLRRELKSQVPPPGLRFDTRLLDLMPEGTVLYAALPNLSETVAKTHQVIQQQIATSPVLSKWWQQQRQHALPFEPMMDEVVGKFSEFGAYLGEEMVVGAQSGSGELEDFSGPLVLALVVDGAGLRAFIEQQLDEHGVDGEVAFLDDPFASGAPQAEVYIWVHDDLAVGSPHLGRVRQVASFVLQGTANPFVGDDFHQRIAELYADGVEILVAVDLEGVIAAAVENAEPGQAEVFARLGMLDAQHLMVQQRHAGNVEHRAVLTFGKPRSGLASWLAEPAPMGALDFVSAEARLVGAFVLKDPQAMLEDAMSFSGAAETDQVFREFREVFGLELDDFVDVLGGELAFAVDGPLLPTPSWKLILEVYDPARFQWILEQGLVEANLRLAEAGYPPLELTAEEVGGRTYYKLPIKAVEVHYTYVEGYLLAAPSRALLDRAIRYRDSGYTITESSRFASLLPVDGRNNFSALVYQDLSGVLQEAAEFFGESLTPEQRAALGEFTAQAQPTLGYAYAEERRIVGAAMSETDVMSALVQRMLGLENPLGFASILGELPLGDL
ncbi:MAG TPA: FecR domain-containing protein [Thermoanaerobaculia bacterium]|jgi:ferric-dicitrate binding protein FerR (iron transport regulator)